MDDKDKQILNELRKNSKNKKTPEGFLYAMLEDAHPAFVEIVEQYAIQFKKAANTITEQVQKAENDPVAKQAWERKLNEVAAELSAKTGIDPFASQEPVKPSDSKKDNS